MKPTATEQETDDDPAAPRDARSLAVAGCGTLEADYAAPRSDPTSTHPNADFPAEDPAIAEAAEASRTAACGRTGRPASRAPAGRRLRLRLPLHTRGEGGENRKHRVTDAARAEAPLAEAPPVEPRVTPTRRASAARRAGATGPSSGPAPGGAGRRGRLGKRRRRGRRRTRGRRAEPHAGTWTSARPDQRPVGRATQLNHGRALLHRREPASYWRSRSTCSRSRTGC